jgi:hypothetical protein
MGVLYLGRSMGKLELITKFRMEQENEHLQAYKRVFPQARPTIFQMELIESTVTDEKAWKKTLEFWAGNDYRPQSVFKMLDYYRTALTPKRDEVGRYVPDSEPYKPAPPCRFCGKEFCFADHREEIVAEDRRVA